MSAKFIHAFTDENPELQKQIGCMTGIFQMFDRHHLLSGRRLNAQGHKRLPPGHAHLNSSLGAERNSSPQVVLEKNPSKNMYENQRVSMESSRTSFSSSSCSSFSSLECNKSTQKDLPAFNRASFSDKSMKTSPMLKSSENDTRPVNLDFREVVKDSIYRDTPGLSVKTSIKEEVKVNVLKHRDSPRPTQMSKSMDGSYLIGMNEKSRVPVDLNESLRVLVKLKGAPWHFSEAGEPPRSSYESKVAPFDPSSRESPRFSYDGRRASLDSREQSKHTASKLRELPRLSLDSREGSLRSCNFDSKPNSILKDLDRKSINRELSSHKRSPSLVAKLMGLEAMPNTSSCVQEPMDSATTYSKKDRNPRKPEGNDNFISKSADATQDGKQDRLSRSPRSSFKEPVTPRFNKSDSIMKPVSNSREVIETAPWRQTEKISIPRKATTGYREAQFKQPPVSVYSEIEKRLKELEFRQSNKDLRALKQILDAMQAKGLLETKNGEKQNSGASVHKNQSTPRAFESPIVIMKPAKSVTRSGVSASSVIPLDGLSDLRKLQANDPTDKSKALSNIRVAKDQTPKSSSREISNRPRNVQYSSKPQQSPKENSRGSVKSPSSLSPRLQQRKLEADRKLRPPLPSTESNKSQRPASNKQQLESVSPRGRLKRKPTEVQESDEQLSETSEMRNVSQQGSEVSLKSDSNISLRSQVDEEVTSADRSGGANIQQRAANKTSSFLKQKKSPLILDEEVSSTKLANIAPEQPSPISVLDDSFYGDDLSASPVKIIPDAFKDVENRALDDGWDLMGAPNALQPKLTSEINHKKLESIQNLVQKLSELSSCDDRSSTTDHIALLCETQSPDHRYVSEILLASGLLLKDLGDGPMGPMPIQLHPSGHPINPDLFLVLEQTKSGCLSKLKIAPRTKPDPEKLQRKLLFDVVNEILIQKLELTSQAAPISLLLRARKSPRGFPSGQRLLRELCSEIDQLQAERLRGSSTDEDSSITGEEVLRGCEGWDEFGKEVPGVVLEIERLIFKDLIDELVIGEAAAPGLRAKSSRRRRQLFAK